MKTRPNKADRDLFKIEPIYLKKASVIGLRGKDILIVGETALVYSANINEFARNESLLKCGKMIDLRN